MARTLHDADERAAIIARIERLQPDSAARWGRMTAGEMLCHLTDPLRATLGEHSVEPAPIRFRWLVKRLALSPIPFPRGRIRAPAQVDPTLEGTAPTDFESDRATLIETLERYARSPLEGTSPEHPVLGPLTLRQWTFFHRKHTDHHLRQFGV